MHIMKDCAHRVRQAMYLICAIAVALTACLPFMPIRQARADDGVYLEVGGQNRYDNYSTAWMYADGQVAYCALPELATPAQGTYTKEPLDDNLHSSWREVVRAMLFYGYGGPGFDPSRYWPQTWYDGSEMTDAHYAALTHILISEAFSRSTESPSLYGCSEEFITWVQSEVIGMTGDSGPWKEETIGGALRNSGLSGDYGAWFDIVMPDIFGAYMLRTGDNTQIVVSYTPYGWIELQKSSADAAISQSNACYSLEGARYEIRDANGDVAGELVCDASGYAKSDALSPGTYYVCETGAPEGYALDVSQYEVEVASSVGSHIDATDMPQRSQVALVIQKTDEATGKDKPQGGATLEGAQFEVCYFDGIHGEDDLPQTPARTWILATDAEGQALLDEAHLVSGDELFRDDSGPVLPLGTVSIREVKAPRGYLIDPRVAVVHVDGAGEETYVERFAAQSAPERVIRGDFDLVKVHGQSMERLAGIPFKVTSETTGESHVIVTDENGYASTAAAWNPHSQNTNGNDWLLESQGDDATAPEKAPDPAAGIWFGTDAPVDDARGALPFDTYRIEELSCKENEGLGLVSMRITVTREGVTVPLGTVDDNDGPRIATTLSADGEKLVPADTVVTLIDTVAYENLMPNTAYTLHATLMDAATGEPARDAAGAAIKARVEFTPTMSSGSQDVAFELDTAGRAGTELVCFEQLFAGERVVATHEDLDDEGQTVRIPAIHTTAISQDSGGHEAFAGEKIAIDDTVSYKGLIPGKTYELSGVLMDATTGEAALDDAGNPITAQTTFAADAAEGSETVSFAFTGTSLAGHDLVVFETLTCDGTEIAIHEDLADTGQTVSLPRIATTALDAVDGDHLIDCAPGQRVVDAVAFENLVPGEPYVLSATLVNAQGDVLASAQAPFEPATADGTQNVELTLDATGLEGQSLVVFEKLNHKDVLVASHCDASSAEQTVRCPSLKTSAADADDGDREVLADETCRIVDHVTYSGLVRHEAYVVRGVLVDKATGMQLADAAGNPIEAVASFIADAEEGEVDVVFEFDATGLGDTQAVVFEQLDHKNNLIARHADLNDEAQTVALVTPPEPPAPVQPQTKAAKSHGVAKTGDDLLPALAALALLACGGITCAATAYALRRRGKHCKRW